MPTVTLRPDGGSKHPYATLTGAATVALALSDDSDSSYVQLNGDDYVAIYMGSLTLGDNRAKSLTPRLRLRTALTESNYRYYLSSTAGSGSVTGIGLPATTSIIDFTGPSVNKVGVSSLTQAVIDGLEYPIYNFAVYGAGYWARIYEAYVDVLYATPPSATALAPSGTVNDPTPDGSFSYERGSDGELQSKRRVKVFSAAQYGAGDFDPDTSTATWDEGETLTSSTVFTVGTPLNEGTYRAYVKAAQQIAAEDHWSDWSYVQFVVDIDEPGVPTIVTVTGDDDLGRIAIDLDATSGDAGTDYFEVERTFDDGLTSEQIRSGGEITYSGAVVHIWDYELASDQQVRYRARAWSTDSGIAVPSEWSSWTSAVSYTSLRWWIKCPNNPAINASFQLSAPPQWDTPIDQGVFVPLDDGTTRTAIKPVVVTGARQAAIGRLFLRTLSAADRSALDALLTDGRVLLVQAPTGRPFGSRYISAGEASFDPFSPNARSLTMDVTVPFVEVASPDGGLDSWE